MIYDSCNYAAYTTTGPRNPANLRYSDGVDFMLEERLNTFCHKKWPQMIIHECRNLREQGHDTVTM